MPDEIVHELPLVEMMARLLTKFLEYEVKSQEERRRAERGSYQAGAKGDLPLAAHITNEFVI